jgi:ketosteroid isomerase-like protein
MKRSGLMEKFLHTYKNLDSGNLHTLRSIYRDDIQFIDPAHEIQGIENLQEYFTSLYANISSIRFDFKEPVSSGNTSYVRWLMTFSHPKLAGNRAIAVDGVSYLEADDSLVYFHRDYFDLGSMLYEHIPVLGRLISSIKKGLGK